MATISYAYSFYQANVAVDGGATGDQYLPDLVASGNQFWLTYDDGTGVDVRLFNADATAASSLARIPGEAGAAYATSPAVGLLPNGWAIVAYAQGSGSGTGISFREVTPTGDFSSSTTVYALPPQGGYSNPDVTVLKGGGFVISAVFDDHEGDLQSSASLYSATGAYISTTTLPLSSNTLHVAALTGGGYVLGWTEASGSQFTANYEVLSATGQVTHAATVIDTVTGLADVQVAALPDGGFALAYVDTNYGAGDDITLQTYAASGALHSDFYRVNGGGADAQHGITADPAHTDGDQTDPALAVLPGGQILVTWTDPYSTSTTDTDVLGRLMSADRTALTGIFDIQGADSSYHEDDSAVAALASGRAVIAWDVNNNGTDYNVHASTMEFTRTTNGDGTAEQLNGDVLHDVIYGQGGNDTIFGAGGDDALGGQTGFDMIFGGDGNDTVYGLEDNDTLQGDGGNDVIFGGVGHDLMGGQAGNDSIQGDDGNDTIYGNEGSDTILGNAGLDQINGGADNDLLGGQDGADTIYGDTGNDTIFGNEGADYLLGQAGNDIINGGADNDAIGGQEGADTIYGDTGNDTIYGLEDNDSLLGQDGDDLVFGGAGNDAIGGQDGADTLVGGPGADALFGGAGPDRFVYTSAADSNLATGYDTIYDFQAGVDKLDLTAVHTSASDRIIYQVVDNSSLAIFVDQGGDGTYDFAVRLQGVTLVYAGDVLF